MSPYPRRDYVDWVLCRVADVLGLRSLKKEPVVVWQMEGWRRIGAYGRFRTEGGTYEWRKWEYRGEYR